MPSDLYENTLVLAAEDCDAKQFADLHVFGPYEEGILRKLMAHGPVLLRGARGSGKSALLRESARRLQLEESPAKAIPVYLSLRHLPLLKSRGADYEKLFFQLLISAVESVCEDFVASPDTTSVQASLNELAGRHNKRVVLFFDDAAHIGREAPLTEFFDIFRTLSSAAVSCKASIYPGVTQFGQRFDVYNDATVVDLARNEERAGFSDFFVKIMQRRWPGLGGRLSSTLSLKELGGFLGCVVLGNVRAFVFVVNSLADVSDAGGEIGLALLGDTLVQQAREYFWPLIDEVKPKLGMYEPLVAVAERVGEVLFSEAAEHGVVSLLVLRDFVERLGKTFEILEYTGFIARREASRGMKSGGRGARFALNLCCLLEKVRPSRLTRELFVSWMDSGVDPWELHQKSGLSRIDLPELNMDSEIAVLALPVESLRKSRIYPYGLTDHRIQMLQTAGMVTVGDVASASDDQLDAIQDVGSAWVRRIRGVVGQAIWM